MRWRFPLLRCSRDGLRRNRRDRRPRSPATNVMTAPATAAITTAINHKTPSAKARRPLKEAPARSPSDLNRPPNPTTIDTTTGNTTDQTTLHSRIRRKKPLITK